MVNDIIEYGNVRKAFMGIRPAPVNTRDAVERGINNIDGVYVEYIEEESGAHEAGMELGDIIKKVDDIYIHKYPDLTGYLSSKRPNDTINVTVKRDEEELVLPVILKERQELIVPEMGMEVKNLTEADKKYYKTKYGVKITGVPERYRGYGLEGKVIIRVDNKDIKNISDADTAFGAISRYGKTIITLLSKGGEKERLIFQ